MKNILLLTVVAACVAVALFAGRATEARNALSSASGIGSVADEPEPVEESMHEFMEYVFQPTFKRLRQSMSESPADNAAWKAIKSDSLILAEGGNLLLIREAPEEPDVWASTSVEVRVAAGELYQAARKKDYETAKGHFATMVTHCNRCHQKFADGKYQLSAE